MDDAPGLTGTPQPFGVTRPHLPPRRRLLRVPAPALARWRCRGSSGLLLLTLAPHRPRLLPGPGPGPDGPRPGDHRPGPGPPPRAAGAPALSPRQPISGWTGTISCTRSAAASSARPTPTCTRPSRPSVAVLALARALRAHCAGPRPPAQRPGRCWPASSCWPPGGSAALWVFPTLVQRLRVAPNALVVGEPVHRPPHPADAAGVRPGPHRGARLPGPRDPARPPTWPGTPRPSGTSGSGTTRPLLLPPSPSSRRSGPTTGSSTWTTTATSSTGRYRQVMLSARELSYQNLPRDPRDATPTSSGSTSTSSTPTATARWWGR